MSDKKEIVRVALPIALEDFCKLSSLLERYPERDLILCGAEEAGIKFIVICSEPKETRH